MGVAVTSIGLAGFWVLVNGVEYFVPFSDCPVFRSATVEQITSVQHLGAGQLHWPALDADVELEALDRPEQYPLSFC
ncbi:MAG: DUF2442 domain-containing protein [Deltaproteobacteria bacterium]|nr:DUF2442 domain-containing protein [Deltaproteobacteria bacterium]